MRLELPSRGLFVPNLLSLQVHLDTCFIMQCYRLNKSLLPYLKAFISVDNAKVQIVCEHTKYFVKNIMHISVFLTYVNQKVAFFDKIKTKRQSFAHQLFDAISPVSPPASLPFQSKEPLSSHFDSICVSLLAF